jgi:hypothetical protein
MAGVGAVVASIYLRIVFLGSSHSWTACREFTKVDTILGARHEAASNFVDFVVAV